MAIGAARDYELFNVDIKAAYLSSKMDVELYMAEPPGHETVDAEGNTGGTVLRLVKALYGAKQSAALFRKRLHGWLVDYGFEPTVHDDCVYTLRRSDGEELFVGIFVDDIIACASSGGIRREFIESLSDEFTIDDRGDLEWALGLRVARDRSRRALTISLPNVGEWFFLNMTNHLAGGPPAKPI